MTVSHPNVKRRDTLAHRAQSLSIGATFLEPHPHLPGSHLGQEALSIGPFPCLRLFSEAEGDRK